MQSKSSPFDKYGGMKRKGKQFGPAKKGRHVEHAGRRMIRPALPLVFAQERCPAGKGRLRDFNVSKGAFNYRSGVPRRSLGA
jgi:hypothetical protein